jgi:uncharacterized protein with beta-barrel porin domain
MGYVGAFPSNASCGRRQTRFGVDLGDFNRARLSRGALLAGASFAAIASFAAPERVLAQCTGPDVTISTATQGPVYGNGAAISVTNSGTISGGLEGVYAQSCNITTFGNSGSVSAATGGIGVLNVGQSIGLLSNAAGGTIKGGNGVFSISGPAGGAAVSNLGTITTLANGGTISGGAGTFLSGAGGAGVSNAAGGTIGALSNAASATINGGSGGVGQIGGAGGTGVANAGTLTELVNSGTISGGDGGTGGIMFAFGGGGGAGGAGVSNAGAITTLTNSGSITGGHAGLGTLAGFQIGGAGVSNGGTITTLTNSGSINGGAGGSLGAGGAGAGVSNTGSITTLTNSGAIRGGHGGLGGIGGAGVANGSGITTLTNTGMISGGNGGLGGTGGSGYGTGGAGVANSGMIATLTNGSAIGGGNGGAGGFTGGRGGAGIANAGTIETLTNSGAIGGGNGGAGTSVAGGAGGAGVSNSGTITALNNSGTIRGGAGGGGPASGAAGDAIYSAGANASIGSITNTGQIIGNVEIDNQASVALRGGSNNTFGSWTGGTIVIGNGDLTFAGGNTALGDSIVVNGVAGALGTGTVYNNDPLMVTTPIMITGNFDQSRTGVLDLNLEPSNDLINVTGTANMAGNVFVNPVNPLAAPGFQIPGTHTPTILHAQGGVTNSGLTLTAFDTAVINYSLIYPDPQDIALKYGIDYSPAGLTQNQHSVGSVIDAIQTAQLSPAFRPIATNLFYLPNVPTLGAAYDSLSGEGASASEQTEFDATNMFLSTTNTQLQRWIQNTCGDDATGTTLYATPPGSLPTHKGEAAPPACASVRTWRIWGTGYGGTANWAGNGSVGSASVTGHASGFGAGLDYEINPNFLLGFAAGGGASSFFVQNRATSGTVDAYHAALYGAWRNLNFYASGILSYDWFNDDESRFASIPGVVLPASNFIGGPYVIPGFLEKPGGGFDADALSGYGEAGYNVRYGLLTATPFVGLEFASLRTGGFTESNQGLPSTISLSYAARTTTSLPSFLGLQLEGKGDLPNAMGLDLWARAAWKHEFDSTRSTESSFIAAPGFDFVVQGAQPPRDALVTSIGAKLSVTKNAAIFGTFESQFGSGSNSKAGTGGLVIAW